MREELGKSQPMEVGSKGEPAWRGGRVRRVGAGEGLDPALERQGEDKQVEGFDCSHHHSFHLAA